MAHVCGPNWFTGNSEAIHRFDPAAPAGAIVAAIAAQTIAVGKAMEKIQRLYNRACPGDCKIKGGSFSLRISVEYKKVAGSFAAKCSVGWLLVVTCEPDGQAQQSPNVEEWERLHRRYAKTAGVSD